MREYTLFDYYTFTVSYLWGRVMCKFKIFFDLIPVR